MRVYKLLLLTLVLIIGCSRNDGGSGIVVLDPPPLPPITDGTSSGQGSGSSADQSGVTITDIPVVELG